MQPEQEHFAHTVIILAVWHLLVRHEDAVEGFLSDIHCWQLGQEIISHKETHEHQVIDHTFD